MLSGTLSRKTESFLTRLRKELASLSELRSKELSLEEVYEKAYEAGIIEDSVIKNSNRELIRKWFMRAWQDRSGEQLWFHAKYVCGFNLVDREPHLDMAKFWYVDKKARVQEEPRNTLKTTILISFLSLEICCFPNQANLLLMYNTRMAADAVSAVRQLLESPIIEHFWGPQRGAKWTSSELSTCQRKKVRKEYNLESGSIEDPPNGKHYEVIVVDDPHQSDESDGMLHSSSRQFERAWEGWRKTFPLQTPKSFKFRHLITTRWGYSDLPGRIFESLHLDPYPTNYRVTEEFIESDYAIRISAIRVAQQDGSYRYYWPGVFDEKWCNTARKELGQNLYWTQMLNRPSAPGTAVFLKDWFLPRFDLRKFAHEVRSGHRPLRVSVGVDPNRSDNSTSAFMGVTGIGRDPDGHDWLIGGRRDKCARPTQRFKLVLAVMLDIYRLFGFLPHRIVWEGFGGQDQDREQFERYLADQGSEFTKVSLWIPAKKDNPGSKEYRIEKEQPDAEQRLIHIPLEGQLEFEANFDNKRYDYANIMLEAFIRYGSSSMVLDVLDSEQLARHWLARPARPVNLPPSFGFDDGYRVAEEPAVAKGRGDIRTAWF